MTFEAQQAEIEALRALVSEQEAQMLAMNEALSSLNNRYTLLVEAVEAMGPALANPNDMNATLVYLAAVARYQEAP